MIRPARHEDLPLLTKWMGKLVDHVRESSGDPYMAELRENYEKGFAPWCREAMDSEKEALFLAEDGGEGLGFILGEITAPFISASLVENIGLITLCWVEEESRNKGVARCLVKAMERWFADKGIRYVDVQFLLGNREAEECWKKMGYEPYRVTSRKSLP